MTVFAGTIMPYGGISAPSGFLLCDGSAVSRTTYATLLAAIAISTTGNTSSGSAIITSIPSTTGMVAGMPISGTGIPASTTILSVDSGTQIHLSANATSTNTGGSILVAPYGVGDGSTTFNVPDLRGRVVAGRDDMGGTAASRLTSTTMSPGGTALGATGGEQTHTLTTTELASHTHTASVTDPGHHHDLLGGPQGSNSPQGLGNPNGTPTSVCGDHQSSAQQAYYTQAYSGTNNLVHDSTTGITVSNSNTGSATAHNNVQPTLILNYIIATQNTSPSNQALGSVNAVIDGGGAVITTGQKGYILCPYAGTITSATLIADQSGSCVIDVWKAAYPTIPTVANTIVASAPPTLSSSQKSQDTTLTGWTKSVSAGDVFGFNVNSASTITRVMLALGVTKS